MKCAKLIRIVVYQLYTYRNCLYRQRNVGIRLSISCSLRHYQFSINAIGDFNAQDYGLLKQKQTTWHLFHIGIRKCPIGFGIFIPNYTFCDFIWLLDNYNNAKSKDALWIINASHMHTSTIDFEYNYGPGTKTQPCKSDAINK